MDVRTNGAVALGATTFVATAAVLGVAGVLAFGAREEVAPVAVQHETGKPGCVMLCEDPVPAPPAGNVHGCSMFCDDPELPPADPRGCQLLCGLDDSKETWQ